MHLYAVCFLHVRDVFLFDRTHDKAETLAAWGHTSSSTNTIDVLFDLRAKIKVNYPANAFEVESSRCDIGADESAVRAFVKAEVSLLAFWVFHVAV